MTTAMDAMFAEWARQMANRCSHCGGTGIRASRMVGGGWFVDECSWCKPPASTVKSTPGGEG